MSPAWTEAVSATCWPDRRAEWESVLNHFARQAAVPDPEAFVAKGGWRGRIGGKGLDNHSRYGVVAGDCLTDDLAVTYELARPGAVDELTQILRPFGDVATVRDDGAIAHLEVRGPHGSFRVRASVHRRHIRATFIDRATRRLSGTLRAQLRKLQACVGCGACASYCPAGAITEVGERYRVTDSCDHCLRCIRKLKAGCLAAHSLNAKAVAG